MKTMFYRNPTANQSDVIIIRSFYFGGQDKYVILCEHWSLATMT